MRLFQGSKNFALAWYTTTTNSNCCNIAEGTIFQCTVQLNVSTDFIIILVYFCTILLLFCYSYFVIFCFINCMVSWFSNFVSWFLDFFVFFVLFCFYFFADLLFKIFFNFVFYFLFRPFYLFFCFNVFLVYLFIYFFFCESHLDVIRGSWRDGGFFKFAFIKGTINAMVIKKWDCPGLRYNELLNVCWLFVCFFSVKEKLFCIFQK